MNRELSSENSYVVYNAWAGKYLTYRNDSGFDNEKIKTYLVKSLDDTVSFDTIEAARNFAKTIKRNREQYIILNIKRTVVVVDNFNIDDE